MRRCDNGTASRDTPGENGVVDDVLDRTASRTGPGGVIVVEPTVTTAEELTKVVVAVAVAAGLILRSKALPVFNVIVLAVPDVEPAYVAMSSALAGIMNTGDAAKANAADAARARRRRFNRVLVDVFI